MCSTGRSGARSVDVITLVRTDGPGEEELLEASGIEAICEHRCLQCGAADVEPVDDAQNPDLPHTSSEYTAMVFSTIASSEKVSRGATCRGVAETLAQRWVGRHCDQSPSEARS